MILGTNLQLFVPKFYFLYKMGTKTAVSVPKGQFQGATGTESALFVPIILLCRKLAIFQPAGQPVGFRRAGVCRCIICVSKCLIHSELLTFRVGKITHPRGGELVDSQLVVDAIRGQEEDCV